MEISGRAQQTPPKAAPLKHAHLHMNICRSHRGLVCAVHRYLLDTAWKVLDLPISNHTWVTLRNTWALVSAYILTSCRLARFYGRKDLDFLCTWRFSQCMTTILVSSIKVSYSESGPCSQVGVLQTVICLGPMSFSISLCWDHMNKVCLEREVSVLLLIFSGWNVADIIVKVFVHPVEIINYHEYLMQVNGRISSLHIYIYVCMFPSLQCRVLTVHVHVTSKLHIISDIANHQYHSMSSQRTVPLHHLV